MIAISDVTDALAEEVDTVLSWDKILKIVSKLHEIDDEWEPVDVPEDKLGYTLSTMCPDICSVAQQAAEGYEMRFLRRVRHKVPA